MKADFEKGTKVCSECRRELPISEFYKRRDTSDGMYGQCKDCIKSKHKKYRDKTISVFKRNGCKRGDHGILLRDYELSKEQLKRRNARRMECGNNKKKKRRGECAQGLLIWYDGMLNDLPKEEYTRILSKEYKRQRRCAINGYIGTTKPSEHFLFDFDLEQMLKDNAYYANAINRYYITKWWDGEIRHWTVNDGVWKDEQRN